MSNNAASETIARSLIQDLSHHKRFQYCTKRPRYRDGRKLTAVKVRMSFYVRFQIDVSLRRFTHWAMSLGIYWYSVCQRSIWIMKWNVCLKKLAASIRFIWWQQIFLLTKQARPMSRWAFIDIIDWHSLYRFSWIGTIHRLLPHCLQRNLQCSTSETRIRSSKFLWR